MTSSPYDPTCWFGNLDAVSYHIPFLTTPIYLYLECVWLMSHLRWDKKWQHSTSSFVSHLSISLQKWTEPDMYCRLNRWKMNKIIKILIQYIFEMKKINQVFCIEGYTSLCFPRLRTSTTPQSRCQGRRCTVSARNMRRHHFQGVHTSPSPCTTVPDKEDTSQRCAYHSRPSLCPGLSLNSAQCLHNIPRKGLPQWFYNWLQTSSSRIFKIMIL